MDFISQSSELFYYITSTSVSVSANNTADITLVCSGVLLQDMVPVMPFNITRGILVTLLQSSTNEVTLRLANLTSSAITIPDVRWAITVKPRY